jgi:hypothetical protein
MLSARTAGVRAPRVRLDAPAREAVRRKERRERPGVCNSVDVFMTFSPVEVRKVVRAARGDWRCPWGLSCMEGLRVARASGLVGGVNISVEMTILLWVWAVYIPPIARCGDESGT